MALTGYPGEHTYELWEGVGQIQSAIGAFFLYSRANFKFHNTLSSFITKIIEESVCLKNTTEEEKEVPITYLSLETTGVGTAISQELLMGNSEHYGSMVEKLEPGEEKVVTYPYEICSIWFHKKDWKNIEMRSFWMTFASYSDKIVLYL